MKKQNVLKKTIFMLMVFSVMFWENGYSATFHWVGGTSTNWNDGSNWLEGNVPGNTDDVVFDATSLPNQGCLLDISTTIHSLTVEYGFGFGIVILDGYTLNITGDIIINEDDFNPWVNEGTINLNGTSTQTISISYSNSWRFNNLSITNTSATVYINSDIWVDGIYYKADGVDLQGTGSINGGPLPIELISFTAESSNNMIILYWSTASEENNDYFVIERSSNCNNWYQLIQIPGAGNSQVPLDYSWIDIDPLVGVSYYRLTQVDYDGQSETFAPIAVNFFGRNPLIYPNPAQNQINLPDFGHIMDQQGKLIFVGEPGENNISFLPSGLYYITINGITQPFIKE